MELLMQPTLNHQELLNQKDLLVLVVVVVVVVEEEQVRKSNILIA
jgi:hypothetical protein